MKNMAIIQKKEIIFATSNKYKFQVAQKSLKDSGFKLVQKKLETPEIQSESVEEIAVFSAKWASDKLKKPVAVSDAGFYIEAFNGFPGPFIKYIDKWFSVKDTLNLMKGKKNRRVLWKDCLAYCGLGEQPASFMSYFEGVLADKAGKNKYRKNYGFIDALFIPQGFLKTLSELQTKEYLEFWSNPTSYDRWKKLVKYLKKQ